MKLFVHRSESAEEGYRELAGWLLASARRAGLEAVSVIWGEGRTPERGEGLHLMVDPESIVGDRGVGGLAGEVPVDLWSQAWLVSAESPYGSFLREGERLARTARGVLELYPESVDAWRARGVAAEQLRPPVDVLPGWEEDEPPAWEKRKYDHLVLAPDAFHRRVWLAERATFWDETRNAFHLFRLRRNLPPAERGQLSPAERTAALRSTRMFLWIGAVTAAPVDPLALLLAHGAGCLLVCEGGENDPGLGSCQFPAAGAALPTPWPPEGAEAEVREARRRRLAEQTSERVWRDLLPILTVKSETLVHSSGGGEVLPEVAGSSEGSSIRALSPLGNRLVFPLSFRSVRGLRGAAGEWILEESEGEWLVVHLPRSEGHLPVAHEFRLQIEADPPPQLLLRVGSEPGEGHGVAWQEVALERDAMSRRVSQWTGPLELDSAVDSLRVVVRGAKGATLRLVGEPPRLVRHPLARSLSAWENYLDGRLEEIRYFARRLPQVQFRQMRRLLQDYHEEADGGSPWESVRIPAEWAPRPRISVVIPLYNYSRYIEESLASVERAAKELGPGMVEAVVVDDASTDGGGSVAAKWAEGCSLPFRLERRRRNRGVATARNRGIDLSRGEWIFLLDADNLLLPQGLGKLYAAGESGTAEVVYGILASLQEGQPRPDNLLSFYPWSPRELLLAPQIDGMALYRKQLLERIGGFDTEMEVHAVAGWEDYELWLHILQEGAEVQFLPDLIGQYRRHPQSMLSETNAETYYLATYLRRRYERLVRAYGLGEPCLGSPV